MFNRRRIGRAVTVAAVVAAVTCVIGAVVAWQLLGDLRTRSAASLDLLERTLTNVDESLAIAQDVTATVGDSLDTIRESLTTLSAGVGDGAAALDSVADLTEDVPPALDRLDATLVDLRRRRRRRRLGAGGARRAPDRAGLRRRCRARRVRRRRARRHPPDRRGPARLDRLDPRAQRLQRRPRRPSSPSSTATSIELDQSLDRSRRLLDSYRADTAEAITLAEDSLDDLDRDIAMSRVLAVVLALSIAVGQVAPFHIGRQLAATPDPQPGQPDALSDL